MNLNPQYRLELITDTEYTCQYCKEIFEEDSKLVIHHRNENREDNLPENLMVVCHPCHQLIHKHRRMGLIE